MKYIDMHCDTLMPFAQNGKETYSIYSNDKMLDLKRLKQGKAMVQFFAIFMLAESSWEHYKLERISDIDYFNILRDGFRRDISAHTDLINFALNYDDILVNEKAGKMSAVLTVEDSRYVNGNLAIIDEFYSWGVRAMTLTWNSQNCFGYPNSSNPAIMSQGLTTFGKEAIEYMQQLGILVDVSHLSEGGFYDVAAICKKPFAATHSNCRALSPHQRNLSDDQLKMLAKTGSITGLNFCPAFVNQDPSRTDSTAAAIAAHARHMAKVAGIDIVALGSDFDGIEGNLEISDCSKMPLLIDALKKEQFTTAEIEKIFYKNALRVIKESMK